MSIALVVAACLGHTVLMIGCHNYLYGLNMSKRKGDAVHLVLGSLTVVFPLFLLLFWGWTFEGLFDLSTECPAHWVLLGYLAICLVAGLVWLPYITLARAMRVPPVVRESSEVVDVARELGVPPLGDGHHSFLGKLPGNQIFQAEFRSLTLNPGNLPAAWEGLTILHLSDMHFHGTPDPTYFQTLFDRCAQTPPDLLCITGDIADSATHHEWIVPVLGRLRWNIAAFAILGNHDHRYDVNVIRREIRKLGILVPENEWARAEVRGEPLVVIGDERPWLPTQPDLTEVPPGFRLYLSHTPDNVADARRAGASLMLSGHVHGGQIRVPPFGALLVPSTLGRRYDGGTYQVGEMILHVSRGLSGEHPVRYNCLPEVTQLTLRRKSELAEK